MQKTIGLVVSTFDEAKYFVKNHDLKQIAFRDFYVNEIKKTKIITIISGSGKINAASATQLLIDKFNPDYLINFGSCGAFSSDLKVGDIIVPNKIIEHDFIELFPKPEPRPAYFCSDLDSSFLYEKKIIVSGDEDIISSERRNDLIKNFNAHVVEQEAAAFAKVCKLNSKEFYVLKIVSDLADSNTTNEFSENVKSLSNKLSDAINDLIHSL